MQKIIHYAIMIALGLGMCASARAQKPELVVETGHSGMIMSTAFSPDGRILASGGVDGAGKLWDLSTGHELRNLAGQGGVFDLAFSPDGRDLITAGQTVTLWDVATGQEVRRLTTGTARNVAEAVAFSPDGRTVAAGFFDHSIKLWDVASGKELRTLTGHTGIVRCISFSPDGRTLASGSFDKTIKLWDVATGKELRALIGHNGDVWSVPFSPDGSVLVSGSDDGTVKLWDPETGRLVVTLTGNGVVMSLSFSPDQKILAAGGDTITLWDMKTGRQLQRLAGDLKNSLVAFSPDGRTLAGASGTTIRRWDVATGQELPALKGHTLGISSVAFTQDGRTVRAASFGRIKLWDLTSGRELRTPISTDSGGTFTRDGQIFASGYYERVITLWDVSTGRELRKIDGQTGIFTSLAFSPDGKVLATGRGHNFESKDGDTTIKFWDVATGRELRTFAGQDGNVEALAFSPDGKLLASSGGYNPVTRKSDNTTKIWDVATGRELQRFAAEAWSGGSLFSPDGRILATASDGTITVRDVETWQELRTIKDVGGCLSFSPDGRILASCKTATIKLLDVATGHELRTLMGHTGNVWSTRFSPDGRSLVSGGGEGVTRIWDVATGKELGALISLDEKDWAVVTPDGVFDASTGGMQLMHWTVGTEIITLDQLKNRYWEPGLLAKIAGFNKEPVRDISAFNNVKLFPAVKFQAPPPGSMKLKLELQNRGGGIGAVEILVNGKELVGDARGSSFDPNESVANLTVDLSGSDYVPGQPNEIRVVTRNQEGYLSSRGVEADWIPEGSKDESPPELWAIVGGISAYASPEVKLRYAAKDATDIAHALQLSAEKLFGVNKVHLTLLSTEESSDGLPPTRVNFEKAFVGARKAKPQDLLLVYLAGHGVALHGDTDLYAYLTADARSAAVEDLSDPGIRAQWTITSEDLTDWIKKIPALKQVMILDTCEAGAAKAKLVEKRDVPADQVRALDRMKDRTGFHVLMGAAVDQPSYEASNYSQGLLTYALLLGMQGAALRGGRFVDVSQWFQYAADEVPELARGIGQSQKPIVAAPSGTSFDVGAVDDMVRSSIHLAKAKPFLLRPQLLDPDQQDDELGLSAALRKRLGEESYARGSGKEASLPAVFIDSDDLPGAIRVGGTYTIQDSRVTVNLSLWRDKKKLDTLQVRGLQDNLPGLVQSLVEAIENSLLRLPRAD